MIILDLSCNRFTGRIMNMATMVNLSVLNLSHNRFSGEIPEALENLKKLRSLKMHGNLLEGLIPPWMGSLVQLKELNLSHNQLVYVNCYCFLFHCNLMFFFIFYDAIVLVRLVGGLESLLTLVKL